MLCPPRLSQASSYRFALDGNKNEKMTISIPEKNIA